MQIKQLLGRSYVRRPRWAPNGFAVIPIATLDPPQRAASPVVPALVGPGPHVWPQAAGCAARKVIVQAAVGSRSATLWNSDRISW